jgi:hypothetical protein
MPTLKPTDAMPPADLHIHQRDDGMYEFGFGEDAAGPFETRLFAEAIASQMATRLSGARLLRQPMVN